MKNDNVNPLEDTESDAARAYAQERRENIRTFVRTSPEYYIRNFDKIKLARRAYSPADLQDLNMNLVGGDPYGGSCTLDQFFVWRPFPQSVNNATAVKDLHLIGAATHPGPGLGGGSGYNLAKRMGA